MPKITAHGGPTNRFEPTEEAEPVTEAPHAPQEPAPDPQVTKPAVNEPKALWVAYAESQGWTREDAETTKKADLVEKLKG
ncbi:hypothetical protein ABZ517_16565 [Streptomyces scabiei]|uniref:hypothetical protein n=1 Tax=Streptomyces scabiei TaxID=1930 RepID=UPI0033E477C9